MDIFSLNIEITDQQQNNSKNKDNIVSREQKKQEMIAKLKKCEKYGKIENDIDDSMMVEDYADKFHLQTQSQPQNSPSKKFCHYFVFFFAFSECVYMHVFDVWNLVVTVTIVFVCFVFFLFLKVKMVNKKMNLMQ